MPVRRRLRLLGAVFLAAGWLGVLPLALAQQPTTPAPPTQTNVPPTSFQAPGLTPAPPRDGMPSSLLVPPPDPDGTFDPVVADTNVSFIDSASPWNVVRIRYDDAYHSNRPTRGDYLITGSGPKDRGFSTPEPSLNYQEASLYAEYAVLPQFSLFIDAPWRFVDPQVNPHYSGPGDLSTGFKLLGLQTHDFTASGQLVVFVPTGKTQDGLGNGHVTAQPGVLTNWQPWAHLILEGQVSCWVPIDASSYGGQMMFYGVGASYGERPADSFWVAPVTEVTGWTLLRGKEQVVYSPRSSFSAHAGSDTIVNGNLGVRAGFGCLGDVFVGYSRPLTGDVWYKEMWRIELRWRY